MVEDDLPARIGRDSALFAVVREDLDPYSVEDLRLRIEMLEAEIARSRAAMDSKTHRRSAADALFSFKGS
ncbi:MAG TPA: DUF1192 domain-containing protein [Asticcacaulis sp.]|jgi:uncharacterized small protein (DUF1192 family)|nr:DUF1192 domain-containing protein [Asticcacaulis sp.]